jgi:hypothetical protein
VERDAQLLGEELAGGVVVVEKSDGEADGEAMMP